jgi:hypothetical protein
MPQISAPAVICTTAATTAGRMVAIDFFAGVRVRRCDVFHQ